jgi:DNA repair exonuclease SbcCD ATPase subunit
MSQTIQLWTKSKAHARQLADITLKRERDRAARVQAQLDQANAAEKAQRAAKTRFRNERDKLRTRAAAGVCPCCGRTFKQLARHMQSKHPDWPEA